jgi:hypothetical protein
MMERRVSLGILSLALASSVARSFYLAIYPFTGQYEVPSDISNYRITLALGNCFSGSFVSTLNGALQESLIILVST